MLPVPTDETLDQLGNSVGLEGERGDDAEVVAPRKMVDQFGPAKALGALGADPDFSAMTVREWVEHHIEHLTGLRKSTLYDYRSYLKNDIDEALGDLPLQALSRDDIARWM
jgi:Phage integrase, N-terminal SAM-like domain